ncbi:Tryptophan synthase alpha chain [Zhongshania aliphaticivorans]|uniref:Tryptophan synthase alpha chain n=1 Tax=Zhongshania aliphaticivorans TaxID=1470434 RepID=A0A5S9QCI7_9GAMM|nr:tryptophan synthase subunit alpha [Zhongshania aliphaticivorans]CAA0087910.1 Tryptophan synthase alpha chain [Zhongshania aliphaticivorans]CAA0115631.1 Tryptophan synthase alpha chain [Zhongshania aliphaticivorans]CAA0120267.1 Tryptophan synthase alpha chain [Zhongshania aliphaticivorans]
MSRLAAVFAKLEKDGRKALVPYIVGGDPELAITVPLMHELVRQGADILEIGVPFSDPMAEGPVIQLAHERALANKVTLSMVLELVAEFREADQSTPIVLMGYANPIERMGYQVFADRAASAGVDGLLTVDMPPEEAERPTEILRAAGIDNIFLLAPTSSDERIKKIVSVASGYLYCVSLNGVTGAGHLDIDAVSEKLAGIKAKTKLPVTVGFGIKDGVSAAALAPLCEGVVVGSALIERLVGGSSSLTNAERITEAADLIGEIRSALDA